MSDSELRSAWEKRAAEKGSTISSVLFQGLPDSLNNYIHEFHRALISKYFLTGMKPNSAIIDLGCGYGRLTTLMKKERPDIEITGLDLSWNYCGMYRQNTGAAVACGTITSPPFCPPSFDGLLAVTALMYVDIESRRKVFDDIIMLLKPGGRALFIDPGEEFLRTVALIKPSARRKSTGGHGFSRSQYTGLAQGNHCKILKSGGMPVFSLLIPLLMILGKVPVLQRPLLSLIRRLDITLHVLDTFTIHRWMVIERT